MPPLAIVSGVSGGIGRTVALRLWDAGYSLLGIGHQSTRVVAAGHMVTRNPHDGQTWYGVALNLAVDEDMHKIRAIIENYNGDTVLLAVCHGYHGGRAPAQDAIGVDVAERIIGVDVLGAFRLCQVAYNGLKESRRGTIALVSSIHAHATFPERVPYAIAKSAMGGLMRGLAVEWGRDDITVNMLTPWQVSGEKTTAIALDEGLDTFRHYRERSPLQRIVDPEDIAETVLWLTRCRSITGSEIPLDCGVRASAWHRPFLPGGRLDVSP